MVRIMKMEWYTDLTALISKEHRLFPWLTQPNRLGAAIKSLCTHSRIKLLSQRLGEASEDEQLALCINEDNSLVREIYILADDIPWVFARVIVPHEVFIANKNTFDNLGEKPIGDTLLFINPNCMRSSFMYGKINHLGQSLLARRSTFSFAPGNLLITEGFLPEICLYKNVTTQIAGR